MKLKRTNVQITTSGKKYLLGKTAEGDKVFLPQCNENTRNAEIGDTFSVILEAPQNLKRNDCQWFGKNPRLVNKAVQLPEVVPTAGHRGGKAQVCPDGFTCRDAYGNNQFLSDHNEKNYIARAAGIVKPRSRPSKLAAQAEAFRRAGQTRTRKDAA